MQFGVLITDGGPHPADKWASTSAAAIAAMIQVNEASTSPAAVAARKAKPRFEIDLADAFEQHFLHFQGLEKAALEKDGQGRYGASLDPMDHDPDKVEAAVQIVEDKSIINPDFAAFYAHPKIKEEVRGILRQHIGTAMQIERSWHADKGA